MESHWPTFLVLGILFGCVVRLPLLHNRVTSFKLFVYMYIFQAASTEVGFCMAFSKVL